MVAVVLAFYLDDHVPVHVVFNVPAESKEEAIEKAKNASNFRSFEFIDARVLGWREK